MHCASVVKARLVNLVKTALLLTVAHLRYIEREGVNFLTKHGLAKRAECRPFA